ncbi:hypothetical protein VCR31J2_1370075 [Vibrio coralliirubri]|uniref:Uncharacterized protein n=1 Tax=Vibrio coralliirubri TaxID=1516159 RepID=A0AA86X357_9VIBR|nr:hypothetical protein VCR20J5_630036 [Vibrio crassostreae]CDT86962.1 hypothetical protein VCR31J2_1370075 [Vibrio coralliirubri]
MHAGTQEKYVETFVTVPDLSAWINKTDANEDIAIDCHSKATRNGAVHSTANSLHNSVVGTKASKADKHWIPIVF